MNDFIFKYHKDLTTYFKKQKKTWDWFSSSKVQDEQLKTYKNNILKNTYRLSPDTETDIYELIREAKETLNIQSEVTVYQELNSMNTNASVSYFEKEIHIVLSGELVKRLNKEELLSVIGHELSHVLFFETHDGQFEITNRIITSIANDYRSDSVMNETARLYRLFVELFCDRGALKVVKNRNTVIEALVKVSTGLEKVSASNYLKQATEIFEQDSYGSSEQTHPETFIRAKALDIWDKKEKEEEVVKLIDYNWGINKLDIFKQKTLNENSRKMLEIITKPKWMRSEVIHSLCKQYYPRFSFSDKVLIDNMFRDFLTQTDDTIKEYFSYILIDFSLSDSSLESAPIGHCFQIAEALGFQKTFKQLLKKELSITARAFDVLIQKGIEEVSNISESEEESILKDE